MSANDLLVSMHHHADEAIRYMGSFAKGSHFNLTHLPRLNRKLSGLNRQQLIVLGSRTSEGKSAFALQCAYEWSFTHKVLYLSLEMTRNEALTRLYSYTTGIPNTDIYSGKHSQFDNNAFREKLRTKLLFCENYGKSIHEIEVLIKDRLSHDKPDIMIVDYIQCIKTEKNRRDDLDNYIREMRKLAIAKDMLIILCSQISRANVRDSVEPSMEGLKETGFLEEHCLDGETLIYDVDENKHHKIKDIFKHKKYFKIKTVDLKTGKIMYQVPNEIIETGELECFEVETKSGKKITVSKGTLFYDGKWKAVEDIKAGSKVYVDF